MHSPEGMIGKLGIRELGTNEVIDHRRFSSLVAVKVYRNAKRPPYFSHMHQTHLPHHKPPLSTFPPLPPVLPCTKSISCSFNGIQFTNTCQKSGVYSVFFFFFWPIPFPLVLARCPTYTTTPRVGTSKQPFHTSLPALQPAHTHNPQNSWRPR